MQVCQVWSPCRGPYAQRRVEWGTYFFLSFFAFALISWLKIRNPLINNKCETDGKNERIFCKFEKSVHNTQTFFSIQFVITTLTTTYLYL